jgi:hypothetical protein
MKPVPAKSEPRAIDVPGAGIIRDGLCTLGKGSDTITIDRKSIKEIFGVESAEALVQVLDSFEIGLGAGKSRTRTKLAMGLLREMKPKDAIEGMLLAQMVLLHGQASRFIAISRQEELPIGLVVRCVNTARECSAAFAEGMETLVRYRSGGKQQVVVSHVKVESGGQAAIAVGGDVKAK